MKPMASPRKRRDWIWPVVLGPIIATVIVAIIPSPCFWFAPAIFLVGGALSLVIGVVMGRETLREVQPFSAMMLTCGIFLLAIQWILGILQAVPSCF